MAKTEVTAPHSEEKKIRRILIVGASGYIGSALAVALKDNFEVFGSYHTHPIRIEGVTTFKLDCLDGSSILEETKRLAPAAIIYCAGFNDRNRCQTEPNKADAINFKAPTIFFKLLSKSTHFIYFSSDEVFGDTPFGETPNTTDPYTEESQGQPINKWAKTKYSGEILVKNHKGPTATFRLGKIYGESFGSCDYEKKSWLGPIVEQLDKKKSVSAFSNNCRSHTYLGDVARAVESYLTAPNVESKLYNLASAEGLSDAAFLKTYCEQFGYDPSLIEETEYLPPKTRETAALPLYSVLNSDLINDDYGLRAQSAAEGILEMKERLRTGWTAGWPL